jgi:hypothetical protein
MIELGVKPNENTLFYAIQTKDHWIIEEMIKLGAMPDNRALSEAFYTKDQWIIDRIKRLIETGK